MNQSLKSTVLSVLAVCAAAIAAHSMAVGTGMGIDDARHLLGRTGFGPTPQEITALAKVSREQAIDQLLRSPRSGASVPPPAFVAEPITPPRVFREASAEARKEIIRQEVERAVDLRAWWVREMITTASPLTERMTLFWHNHFVSSQQKVRSTKLLYQQNVLLRQHALGNFGDLLHDIAKDPAMVVYLDSATNRKEKPNENFAREVMELFTLGVGNYGENDIREAARAFTGWSIDPENFEFMFRRGAHDNGTKTVLGTTGNLDGDGVLDILLAHPASAKFIVTKLWREFVSPEPDLAEVDRIARAFRAGNYEIRVALRELLHSPAFWAVSGRGALIKSPIDLVVGTVRQFGFDVPETLPLAVVSANLGQNLFAPPNVKGWPGGEAWINSATLLGRKQFLERLFRGDDGPRAAPTTIAEMGRMEGKTGRVGPAGRQRFASGMAALHFDSSKWIAAVHAQSGPAVTPMTLERAILAAAPANADIVRDGASVETLRALVLDPAYQLK